MLQYTSTTIVSVGCSGQEGKIWSKLDDHKNVSPTSEDNDGPKTEDSDSPVPETAEQVPFANALSTESMSVVIYPATPAAKSMISAAQVPVFVSSSAAAVKSQADIPQGYNSQE